MNEKASGQREMEGKRELWFQLKRRYLK